MTAPYFVTIVRNFLWTAPRVFLATVVMGSASLLVSLFSSTGRTQHRLAKRWSRMLLGAARVKVVVEGLDKIAPGGSYVFVANHRSYYDVPVILPHISVQFRFLAYKGLFKIPFIGYHLSRAGHFPVPSDNARESLKSMSDAARLIRKRGISILLFPEGERTRGEMLPFKDGAAYIAIRAGVPIVPIGLIGVGDVMAVGSPIVRGGVVRMVIGDPIPTLEVGLNDRARLTREIERRVAELCGQAARAAA
jgi:1-acyl-sn-glycerol-3-phosphate acyltransferase